MKVAILGYGKQGRSAFEYWSKQGNTITICDIKEDIQLPDNVGKQLGEKYLSGLSLFDLIVRSPIVHPKDIVEANNPDILKKVTTVTNEFFKVCPTKNIVGVTGTKGKGTTSTLITKMIEASGMNVHFGGNIGIAPLDLLKENIKSDDWVVLELANFQLIDINYGPKVGVCLMVTPEHLDWHKDVAEYVASKQRLFSHQSASDIAVYFQDNNLSEQVASISPGHKIPYSHPPGAVIEGDVISVESQTICRVDEVKLLGKHNLQNVCAAITAVWQISKNVSAIRSVLTSFSGLPHRLEFIRSLDNVCYYDDSFATTPESATVAVEAFAQPKVVILGGSDKGASYDNLAKTIKANNVHQVIMVGETGPAITAALRSNGFSNISDGGRTMTEIVNNARRVSKPGDVVLLSTGCASFDLFKNYEDRGDQFKQAVLALA